jgi:hypothetical protein
MDQAIKKISIKKYLLEQGFSPKKETSRESWFSSPLRSGDRTPSFKVDESKNLWYDFGAGVGGSIIDLVMEYQGCSLAESINHLEKFIGLDFSFNGNPEPKEKIRILRVSEIRSRALLNYIIRERKIDLEVAKKYLLEAHYLANEKQYFALAFKNDVGGYELRSPYFKGSTSPKHLTTIPGEHEMLNLFEGFMDFLSALTYLKTLRLKYRTIVLNSVSNISKLSGLSNIPRINLFLDNDQAGQGAVAEIGLLNDNTRDYSIELYPMHKDFNEMLISTK